MVVGALLAMAIAIALLVVSLFRPDGLTFVVWSLVADAAAVTLLVGALRRRRAARDDATGSPDPEPPCPFRDPCGTRDLARLHNRPLARYAPVSAWRAGRPAAPRSGAPARCRRSRTTCCRPARHPGRSPARSGSPGRWAPRSASSATPPRARRRAPAPWPRCRSGRPAGRAAPRTAPPRRGRPGHGGAPPPRRAGCRWSRRTRRERRGTRPRRQA